MLNIPYPSPKKGGNINQCYHPGEKNMKNEEKKEEDVK
jgi:hypothetical protein